ncbi:MAG TPA: metalloregulator ArsR/SmtB family transcription factor [Candidatus Saccharimonadales bacterium]|nr:metalloregulator ArsR/SmtB family transcription factor [Candidatus Saccharimonadales bacterium]
MRYVVFDDFFAVLGNPQRVRILQYLNRHGSKNVSQLCEKLGLEQSAVSHSLRRLSRCHFVECETRGKERIYSINKDTVQPLFNLIDEHVRKYCVHGCEHWNIKTKEVIHASR